DGIPIGKSLSLRSAYQQAEKKDLKHVLPNRNVHSVDRKTCYESEQTYAKLLLSDTHSIQRFENELRDVKQLILSNALNKTDSQETASLNLMTMLSKMLADDDHAIEIRKNLQLDLIKFTD
ncbi:hypothetical protein LOZ61_006170, partial [Ophidiomyces ophidiicola]